MGMGWSKELAARGPRIGDIAGFGGLDGRRRICHRIGMDLGNYQQMDPHMLVGLVNTELRNACDSLEDLVKTHQLDEDLLVEKLKAATYEYRPELNQFR